LQEVSILVYDVLKKQPREAPSVFSVVQKKGRSGRKMHEEISSTNPRRWEMPPKSLSPGSPEASRAAAHSRRRELIGWRRRVTTKEAKRGERGQPWLTPSFMRRVHQVPSSHLWCTVVAF